MKIGLPAPTAPISALIILVIHGAFTLWTGPIHSPDSKTYAFWSGRLIETGFNYIQLLGEADTEFPAILYALFATVTAILRLTFGDHWPTALVAVNFLAHLGLGVLLVRLAIKVTASDLAGWVALALFVVCYDLLNWVPFVLSDATFCLLAFLTFWLAASRILDERRAWTPAFLSAAVGSFYRPTGLVMIPELLFSVYLSRAAKVPFRLLLASLALAVVAGALAFGWFMQDPARWPFETLSNAFEHVAKGYAVGEVVSARPETYHSAPAHLLDYALISGDRFLHFFAIGAQTYSLTHWLMALAFFVPCYALAGWMLFALCCRPPVLGLAERKVLLAAIGAVAAYSLFHALVQIDYDWRYRAPVLSHLILLAAAGAADLYRRRKTP